MYFLKTNKQTEVMLKEPSLPLKAFRHEKLSPSPEKGGDPSSAGPTQIGGRGRAEHEEQQRENAKRRGLGGEKGGGDK